MRLDMVLSRLKMTGQQILRTADACALLNISRDHASHILSRLEESGHLVRIKNGLWCFSGKTDAMQLAEFLTAPFPSYISLQSALYLHGMISQIPASTYCVSLARTRTYRTPVGDFSIHHISGDFFMGYEETGDKGLKIAVPEKALLDFLYLSPARSRLFSGLPELEIPRSFSIRKARMMIGRIPAVRRRAMLEKKFDSIMSLSRSS